MSDWPLWAKLSAGLGVPVAVMIWLGIFITPLIVSTAAAMTRHAFDAQRDAQVQTALLRQICRNGAKSELQMQFCNYGLPDWPTQ